MIKLVVKVILQSVGTNTESSCRKLLIIILYFHYYHAYTGKLMKSLIHIKNDYVQF